MDPFYRYQIIVIVENAETFYASLQSMQLREGKCRQILFESTRNFVRKSNTKIIKVIITFVTRLVTLK